MRAKLTAILIAILIVGCSGSKSTDPRSEVTFEVSTTTIHLRGVATAIWPESATLTLKNVDQDSVELFLIESCDWLSTSKPSVKLCSGDSAQVTVTVSMKTLIEGAHDDTIMVIDYGNGGLAAFVVVSVVATQDSTYAYIEHPYSSATYMGSFQGYYCYLLGSAWYLMCHSNSGNPIKVFAYEVWSGGKLAEEIFAPRSVAPGDSLECAIGFEGCVTTPPPLYAYWTVRVGYRVGSEEHWLVEAF